MHLEYDRSEKKLKVTVTMTVEGEDGTENNLVLAEREYYATNNVRTPEEREKPEYYNGYYYYPGNFPNGEHKIVSSGESQNGVIGPYLLADAQIEVQTYEKNEEGEWVKSIKKMDGGFEIHGGDGQGNTQGDNNEDYPTWGCIRVDNSVARELIKFYKMITRAKGSATLTVKE